MRGTDTGGWRAAAADWAADCAVDCGVNCAAAGACDTAKPATTVPTVPSATAAGITKNAPLVTYASVSSSLTISPVD